MSIYFIDGSFFLDFFSKCSLASPLKFGIVPVPLSGPRGGIIYKFDNKMKNGDANVIVIM